MDYSRLGERIKERRTFRGWTQHEAAQRMGISPAFLGHIERGTRKASVDTLVMIANTFNCGVDELLRDSLKHSRFMGKDVRQLRDAATVLFNYFEEDDDRSDEDDESDGDQDEQNNEIC